MTNIVTPGTGLLLMKIGTHARESLTDIIERKSKEIHNAGFAMWGYGGNTCHPRTMVQPFAEDFRARGLPIYLVMEEMESSHFAEPIRADEYSPDGMTWHTIPAEINVLGSRFALMIKDLRREEHILPLNQTRVAIGTSRGRLGSRYLRGRVDKACLEVTETPEPVNEPEPRELRVGLVAELVEPYAVFLRYDG